MKPMHWYLGMNGSVLTSTVYFKIESDHKLPEQIIYKNLADTPAGSQRMMM